MRNLTDWRRCALAMTNACCAALSMAKVNNQRQRLAEIITHSSVSTAQRFAMCLLRRHEQSLGGLNCSAVYAKS